MLLHCRLTSTTSAKLLLLLLLLIFVHESCSRTNIKCIYKLLFKRRPFFFLFAGFLISSSFFVVNCGLFGFKFRSRFASYIRFFIVCIVWCAHVQCSCPSNKCVGYLCLRLFLSRPPSGSFGPEMEKIKFTWQIYCIINNNRVLPVCALPFTSSPSSSEVNFLNLLEKNQWF